MTSSRLIYRLTGQYAFVTDLGRVVRDSEVKRAKHVPALFSLTLCAALLMAVVGALLVAYFLPVDSGTARYFVFFGALAIFGAVFGMLGAAIGMVSLARQANQGQRRNQKAA